MQQRCISSWILNKLILGKIELINRLHINIFKSGCFKINKELICY